MPKYSHKSKRRINKVGGFVVEKKNQLQQPQLQQPQLQQPQLQQPQSNLTSGTDDLNSCITALKNNGHPKIAKMIEVIKTNIDNGNFKKGNFSPTQMINTLKTLKTTGGKPKRKSVRKSKRKSVRKSRRKLVRKSRRKSVRKSKRKSRRKSKRKSRRKSVRKSRRKSRRKNLKGGVIKSFVPTPPPGSRTSPLAPRRRRAMLSNVSYVEPESEIESYDLTSIYDYLDPSVIKSVIKKDRERIDKFDKGLSEMSELDTDELEEEEDLKDEYDKLLKEEEDLKDLNISNIRKLDDNTVKYIRRCIRLMTTARENKNTKEHNFWKQKILDKLKEKGIKSSFTELKKIMLEMKSKNN